MAAEVWSWVGPKAALKSCPHPPPDWQVRNLTTPAVAKRLTPEALKQVAENTTIFAAFVVTHWKSLPVPVCTPLVSIQDQRTVELKPMAGLHFSKSAILNFPHRVAHGERAFGL
jgi:hypothetical protein